jgi:alkanesulfonate monooxygenase SsuD/methylene tetrahydromethanopterin reductase-like flavin-dependent oxidoreductase (luciferase family)
MHVGMGVFFQNFGGHSDSDIYRHELAMADRAEPTGFESIWTAEHHFDGYTMCPSVVQFLSYMAGRTRTVQLGSMVMVLPWHHPVRVAEEFGVLDHLSQGRALLGMGRGLGRIEFEGLRCDMNESRERFVEYSDAILQALETGVMEYDGKLLKQPRVEIRPTPFASFRGRLYASAISPESARIMARLGVGILIIAQKPWEKTLEELNMYREMYRELNNGEEAPKPLLVSFTACHEDASVADEMHKTYIRNYCRSALEHYEFDNLKLSEVKGYEYYAALAKTIAKHGSESFVNFLADLQVWGTPDQVFERIVDYSQRLGAGGVINAFSFGGMPPEMARTNMELYATKVLPRLKAIDVGATVGRPASAAA